MWVGAAMLNVAYARSRAITERKRIGSSTVICERRSSSLSTDRVIVQVTTREGTFEANVKVGSTATINVRYVFSLLREQVSTARTKRFMGVEL